jgi:Tfp pilus assembly PilM family ATPase
MQCLMAHMDEPSTTDVPLTLGAAPTVPSGQRRGGRLQVVDRSAERSGEGIGVAWDGDTLHVAHVTAVAGQSPTLVTTRAVRTAPADGEQTEGDAQPLGRVLREVCGDRPRARLWTALDSPATLTQIIRVPMVRDSLLPNVAFWTLRKGKSVAAEGAVLDFEVLRTVEQDRAHQIELFAMVASRAEIDGVNAEFRAAGYPLHGVVPNALAFRNFLRFAWPEACRGQCVLVCVNEENTEVLLVSDGKPLGTRSVRTGMGSLRHAFAQHLDVEVTDPRVEECMAILRGGPLPAAAPGRDSTPSADEVFGWVRPAARRLVRNVQRALHGFEVEHGVGDGAVFLVTGRIVAYPVVGRFLGTQLGVHLQGLTDPSHAVGLRASVPAAAAPAEAGAGRAVAIGLALAAVYPTGNFLFTFQDRLRERRHRRLEHACLGLGVALLAVLLCAVGALEMRVHRLQRECARLRASSVAPDSQRNGGADIAALMARVAAAQVSTRKLAEIYYAPAVVAEVASLTSAPVHLLTVDMRLVGGSGDPQGVAPAGAPARTVAGRRAEARQVAGSSGASSSDRPPASKLTLQGVIAGRRDRVDSELAAYVLRLRQSPFLESPVVTERRVEAVDAAYLASDQQDTDQMLFFGVEMNCRHGPGNGAGGTLPPARPSPAAAAASSAEVRP